MLQSTPQFQKATEMFYSMQYQQGLKLINECIEKDPTNSILYSNRALFYSQIGYIQEAYADLNSALQLNYLNYIAYFNLFSLLMRCQKFDQAFQNLCCSLSCLYLIRAKNKKSELDASKSIKYAQNNMEAHVLKGLINLQNGKYKLALNELDWACQINPSHQVVRNIRNLIFKKMNPGLGLQDMQNRDINEEQQRPFIRLESSYSVEQNDKQKELRDKISEFNELYNNLNEYQGTITTKVNKQNNQTQKNYQLQNANQSNNSHPKQTNQNQQNLIQYHTKVNTSQNNIHTEDYQAAKEISESQKFVNQSNTNNQTLVQQNSIDRNSHHDQSYANGNQVITLEQINPDQLHFHQPESTDRTYNQQVFQRQTRQISHDFSGIIADDGVATPSRTSLAPEPGQYINTSLNQSQLERENQKQFYSINNHQTINDTQRFSDFQSMINSNAGQKNKNIQQSFESFVTQNHHQISNETSIISNSLYPKPENSMIQISILKMQITDKTKEEIEKMSNIYCIANYLNSKQTNGLSSFKMRTACQKGYYNGVEWNETFDPIQIPEQPECMKIKVYNKKYSSYRDDLIGEMQVEISTHGLVKLPLFNKKGDLSGSLYMNLQLIFPPISQADENQQNL